MCVCTFTYPTHKHVRSYFLCAFLCGSDILDFERIEAGSMELEQVPFSVSHELQKVQTMLSRVAAQKKLSFGMTKLDRLQYVCVCG